MGWWLAAVFPVICVSPLCFYRFNYISPGPWTCQVLFKMTQQGFPSRR